MIIGPVLGLILFGWLDYLTGPQIGMSPLYLIPIGAAAWYGGARIGAVMSILGAAIWFLAGASQ